MPARWTQSFVDYNREPSTVSLRLSQPADITDPLLSTALQVGMNALKSAIEGVSLGLPTTETRTYMQEKHASPTAAAASINAQRERKWLVRYYDAETFDTGTFEIPAADLSLLQPNSEFMDISGGPGAALVTAVENHVKSPAGNAVIVVEVVHVGRNT
jgi:hypothetical protein